MDALKVVRGSPLLQGTGLIFLVSAAAALGLEPLNLALELTNRGAELMANADGWNACDVADIRSVDREDGYHLWQSVMAEGEQCHVGGLVTLLDASVKVLEFTGAARISAWRIRAHNRNTLGEVFVEPNSAWLELADLLVRKGDVEALRVAAATAITAATAAEGLSASTTAGTSRLEGSSLAASASIERAHTHAAQVTSAPDADKSPVRAVMTLNEHQTADVGTASAPSSLGRHAKMKVSKLIDEFIKTKSTPDVGCASAAWKPDETLRNRQKLRCFPELMGDLTMAELELMPEAESTIRAYVQRLMTMPTGPQLSRARAENPSGSAPELAAWAARNSVETMSAQTAQSYRAKLAECFTWGVARTYLSLSGILCARHSMTTRSIYANKQDEVEERGHRGQVGGVADDPEGTA